MASKTVRTPNARLFATDGCDESDSSQKPRRVKNYMKSSIFDDPSQANGHHAGSEMSDSGSETASNDGDRQVSRLSPAPISVPAPAPVVVATTPVSADKPRGRVPPGGFSSKLW